MKTIIHLPFIIAFLFGLFSGLLFTGQAALWLFTENNPIEFIIFAFLLLGGLWGLQQVWRTSKHRTEILASGFYTTISIGLLRSIYKH